MVSVRSIVKSPGTAAWAALALALALGLGAFPGCNVFSPLAADGNSDLNYRGLILKGNQAINDGDYALAADYYERAMRVNPGGSEAYLYHSKALISLYGIDYNELNLHFECKRETRVRETCEDRGIDTSGIPFVDSTTTVAGIDSVYYPVATAVRNLEHILRKAEDTISLGGSWKMYPDGDTAGDGRISDGVARLDLGLLQAVKAMLAPLDLDGSDRIDAVCGLNLCPEGPARAACKEGASYREKCRDGDSSEIKRLESFKKLTANVSLDDLDSKDVNARNVSTNPNDINAFLDAMQGPVAGSNFNLDSVTGSMQNHGQPEMSEQLSGIVGNINDLNNFLSYMRYDDSVDNDMDGRRPDASRDSIMVWHDFDRDGFIRYDYGDRDIEAYGLGAWNLGNPIHRHVRPNLYQTFADWSGNHPGIARDSSKNSRKALMIKHCRDMVAGWPAGGAFTEAVKTQIIAATCTTYTTLLKPGAPRPRRSDWVGGVPGVDEEMVDERDNDYDGLKDEDARNARVQDDDDDARLDTTMIDDPAGLVRPMAWAEAAGSATNRCPDIEAGKMPAAPRQRQNCVGALEHRIFLAKTYPDDAEDTLATYYSRFTGTENGPHPNCLEDFQKLPAEYRAAEDLEVTDPAVRTACKFKHIWIRPIPPGSEWTSGIFGIDEEILDGVDNDGDGWIDEDLK